MLTTKKIATTAASLASVLVPMTTVSADENTEKVDLSKTISVEEYEAQQANQKEAQQTNQKKDTQTSSETDITVEKGHVTKWVDEDGKPLKPAEDGSHPDTKGDALENRQLISVEKDANGDLINTYKNIDVADDETKSDELLLTGAGKTIDKALKNNTKIKEQQDTTPSSTHKTENIPSASKNDNAPSASTKTESKQSDTKAQLDDQLKRLNADINKINELSPGTFSEGEIKEMNDKFPNLSPDKREEFLKNLEKTIDDIQNQKGTAAQPADQPAAQPTAQPSAQPTAQPAVQPQERVPLNSSRSNSLPSTGESSNQTALIAGGLATVTALGLIATARRKQND